MSMPTNDELIDRLTEDLEPTPPVSPGAGRWLIAAALLIAAFLLIERFGMRRTSPPVNRIQCRFAILVVLAAGSAAAVTVTAMARPAVGSLRNGWQWTVAAFAGRPLALLLRIRARHARCSRTVTRPWRIARMSDTMPPIDDIVRPSEARPGSMRSNANCPLASDLISRIGHPEEAIGPAAVHRDHPIGIEASPEPHRAGSRPQGRSASSGEAASSSAVRITTPSRPVASSANR